MSDPATAPLFGSLAWTAGNHFRLWFFETIARLRAAWPEAGDEFPFLAGYFSELDAERRLDTATLERFRTLWERSAPRPLPLVELARRARLDDTSLATLFTIGLPEEDHRFTAVFEALQGPGRQRPTVGMLDAWVEGGDARTAVPELVALGLVEVVDPAEPRAGWALQVPTDIWDALRGAGVSPSSARVSWRHVGELLGLEDLILTAEEMSTAAAVAPLLARDAVSCVTIRGPAAVGRRTLAGALARELGSGLVEVHPPPGGDPSCPTAGPLAVLLEALPLVVLDLAPGEVFRVPPPLGALGPVAITLGEHGGIEGPCMDSAVSVTLAIPGPQERRRHWEQALGTERSDAMGELAARSRMTGGNIRRTAALALAEAALFARTKPNAGDVRRAVRSRSGQLLDTLADRVRPTDGWSSLAVADETLGELLLLEQRCRHREDLTDHVGATLRQDLGAGVRALFTGSSGTGKTLAARTLATVLDRDLYRIDLSMVIDKYIGETEKNLSRIFDRAEEADIALLLDEGDSLLTQRTSVESSHDRYANLETNYLLQRLESFQGILIVTTNAGDRIDSAFRRRMDVVIDFHAPSPIERWSIWSLHLPESHAVSTPGLEQVSARCALTGGQIRNAVLHAALLSLGRGDVLAERDLLSAVRREYRKAGQVFPLPEVMHG